MSKNGFRFNNRTKSGRTAGPSQSFHGVTNQANVNTLYNDPALMINQINTTKQQQCDCKPLLIQKDRDFKEMQKRLKSEIENLEKIIAQLKLDLKISNTKLEELKVNYEDEIAKLKRDLQTMENKAVIDKESIKDLEQKCNDKDLRLVETQKLHNMEINKLIMKYEKQIKDVTGEKDKEIAIRDDKISTLKSRMAEAIGKNSLERQKQLDELKRELIGAAEEARGLHSQLKKVEKKKCKNCDILQEKLEEKILEVRLKEKALFEYQNIGKKMQVQLNQQDVILQKWEEREKREKMFDLE